MVSVDDRITGSFRTIVVSCPCPELQRVLDFKPDWFKDVILLFLVHS